MDKNVFVIPFFIRKHNFEIFSISIFFICLEVYELQSINIINIVETSNLLQWNLARFSSIRPTLWSKKTWIGFIREIYFQISHDKLSIIFKFAFILLILMIIIKQCLSTWFFCVELLNCQVYKKYITYIS